MGIANQTVLCGACGWQGPFSRCRIVEAAAFAVLAICPACGCKRYWPTWLCDAARQEVVAAAARVEAQRQGFLEQLRFGWLYQEAWMAYLAEVPAQEERYRDQYFAWGRQQRNQEKKEQERQRRGLRMIHLDCFCDSLSEGSYIPGSLPARLVNRGSRVWVDEDGYLDGSHVHVVMKPFREL